MNREIKFRMWHKKSKKMFDVESINFKDRIVNIWNSGMYSLSTFCLDDVILMQYTGLHDKNGKEIYEGDILKVPVRRCGNSYGNWWQDKFSIKGYIKNLYTNHWEADECNGGSRIFILGNGSGIIYGFFPKRKMKKQLYASAKYWQQYK